MDTLGLLPRLACICILLWPVAASAEPLSDEQLIKKLRVLVKDKTERAKLSAIVCQHDASCTPVLTAQAKAPAGNSAPAAGKKSKPDYEIHHTVLLRDAYSPVAFITGDSDASQKGATFTLTDDLQARKTTFVGKGSLMFASYGNVDTNKSALPIGHIAFVPGVEWNRKVVNGVDSGTMSARAGAEIELVIGTTDHYLRSNAVYTTDVGTRANLYGVENGWQPVNNTLWWNVRKRLWLDAPVWFGFYPSLNGNYYHSASIGALANLTRDQDYFWTGPALAASIDFDPGTALENLSFNMKYFYLYDAVRPRNATVNYLEMGMEYKIATVPASALANSGTLGIDVHYTSGRTPQTLEPVAEWYAGLILKLGSLGK